MKTNIVYSTMTGHSKKVAKAIGNELGIDIINIKSNYQLNDVDLLYIVSGIYGDKSSPNLIEYVKTLNKDQISNVILITLSGAKTTKATEVRELLDNNGIKVLEEFVCPGGFLCFGGHPNKEDITNVINFIKKTAK